MMEPIRLYSEFSEPYGVLGNNARIHLLIDNEDWQSVNDYVYTNLFTSIIDRQKIRERTFNDPFVAAMEILADKDVSVFEQSIIEGTRARFTQHPELKTYLKNFTGTSNILLTAPAFINAISLSEKYVKLLTVIRQSIENEPNFFIDLKYGKLTYQEVNNTIRGVQKKLLTNSEIKHLNFNEAKQYSIHSNDPPTSKCLDVENLDYIVEKLKNVDAIKNYRLELDLFKEHLLDIYLDYILETHYTNLKPSQYSLAKQQQIQLDKSIVYTFQNRLLKLYENGDLSKKSIISKRIRLSYPTKPKSIRYPHIRKLERQQELSSSDVVIDETNALNPFYDESIEALGNQYFDGSEWKRDKHHYRNVWIYAYHRMAEAVSHEFVFDIPYDLPLHLVSEEYSRRKNDFIGSKIRKLNEIATWEKFKYNGLVELLLRTGNRPLIWDDSTDLVLGGIINSAGTLLQFIRSDKLTPIPNILMRSYSLTNEPVFKNWFLNRCRDFNNTLNLLGVTNDNYLDTNLEIDLMNIYGIKPIPIKEQHYVPKDISYIMASTGLTELARIIIYNIIYAEYYNKWYKLTEHEAIKSYVFEYDIVKQPSSNEQKSAKEYLKKAYKNITSIKPIVSENVFIAGILNFVSFSSNDNNVGVWSRIKRWSSF